MSFFGDCLKSSGGILIALGLLTEFKRGKAYEGLYLLHGKPNPTMSSYVLKCIFYGHKCDYHCKLPSCKLNQVSNTAHWERVQLYKCFHLKKHMSPYMIEGHMVICVLINLELVLFCSNDYLLPFVAEVCWLVYVPIYSVCGFQG